MSELEVFNNFFRDFNEMNSFLEDVASHVENVDKGTIRRKRLNPFLDLTENEFKKYYHFSMENMRRIIDMVRDDLLEADQTETRTNQVPVEFQIMSAIRLFAGEHPELVGMAHSISIKTLNKICKRVATALSSLASIRMPATLSEKESVTSAFNQLGGMPQVIGALKQFNIPLKRCNLDSDDAIHCQTIHNHGEYMQVQIITDASFKIRNLDCQLRLKEEKYNAKEMFTHTRKRFEQNEFRGRVVLADNNLKCCSFLFTPVQCPVTKEEQAFNKAHEITLNTVNNCVKIWKKRFMIIESGMYFTSASSAKQTLTALALLHNMSIEWNDDSIENVTNSLGNAMSEESRQNTNTQARSDFIKSFFK